MTYWMIIPAVLVYLWLGVLVVRRTTGAMIAMMHYNFPWLGLLLLVGCIVLWPIQYLVVWAIVNIVGD